MKIIYFDLFNGVSGDMILGALFDAGLPYSIWKREIDKLNLSGYEIEIVKKEKKHISGIDFNIKIFDKKTERRGVELIEIVEKSSLSNWVKEKSIEVLNKLINAESKIHNENRDNVHLHEIGGLDTIIDIVGSLLGIEILGIEKVYSSLIPIGSGYAKTSHGILPVPAPATVEILKGFPIYSNGVFGEITTPTGAAIITTISNNFGEIPSMKIEKIGYGLGKKDFDIPNILRVFIGELYENYLKNYNILIETNIDDMNPQILGFLMEKALSLGALDIFFTPIFMKKNRPAYKVSILCEETHKNKFIDLIFKETSSIGVRVIKVEKVFLKREIRVIETKFGKVRVKISNFSHENKITLEYEDLKKISEKENIPLNKVYDLVLKEINKILI
jgi:uncharacterized protein (TIGR00299 family) protein